MPVMVEEHKNPPEWSAARRREVENWARCISSTALLLTVPLGSAPAWDGIEGQALLRPLLMGKTGR